ncbi:MAG: cupin domain-containing protein [Candidatus Solibacter usitatus]|nr:cupin domain-containing protein [Candidatus Solibacter usitatus]
MKHHNWNAIPEEQMNALVGRKVIHGEKITVARLRLAKGAIVPLHSHVNEQISMLESGRMRFVIAGDEKILGAGESLQIPPHAPHMVEALEDSVAVDLFSPIREDWIRGDDAYLRGGS